MILDEERQALIQYRLEKSNQAMHEAEENAKLGFWTLVVQRLYYSAYYAVTAKLIEKGIGYKTHAGVM